MAEIFERSAYTAGTATVAVGADTVNFSGTALLANAFKLDTIQIGQSLALIKQVVSNTQVKLYLPWSGLAATAAPYVIANLGALKNDVETLAQLQALIPQLADALTAAEADALYLKLTTQTLTAPEQGQARANLGLTLTALTDAALDARFPRKPQTASGVGQFAAFNTADNTAAVLPAGGTWVYSLEFGATGGSMQTASAFGSIAAGGTVIGAATPGGRWSGWYWRIA